MDNTVQQLNSISLPCSERRSEDRWLHYAGCTVGVEGFLGRIQDLSSCGARITCQRMFAPNEVIRVDLPWGVPVRATVLESAQGRSRLQFDYPVEAGS